MNKETITFDDNEIEKCKFHYHKKPIMVHNLNIDKIMKSIKVSPGRKNINNLLVAKMVVIHKCF